MTWTAFLGKALWGLDQAVGRLGDVVIRRRFEEMTDWWRDPIQVGEMQDIRIPEETAVSGAIQELFEEIVAEQVISGSPCEDEDLRQFQFATEKRRARDPAIGKRTKPTDIAIILKASEIFDLRIEAKTVVAVGEVGAQYMSERGLLRFEDGTNPYTIEAYGGMLAYVIDESAAVWQRRIQAAVLARFGAARLTQTLVGGYAIPTTKHSFELREGERRRMVQVDVLHLVKEIETRPSLRPPNA